MCYNFLCRTNKQRESRPGNQQSRGSGGSRRDTDIRLRLGQSWTEIISELVIRGRLDNEWGGVESGAQCPLRLRGGLSLSYWPETSINSRNTWKILRPLNRPIKIVETIYDIWHVLFQRGTSGTSVRPGERSLGRPVTRDCWLWVRITE